MIWSVFSTPRVSITAARATPGAGLLPLPHLYHQQQQQQHAGTTRNPQPASLHGWLHGSYWIEMPLYSISSRHLTSSNSSSKIYRLTAARQIHWFLQLYLHKANSLHPGHTRNYSLDTSSVRKNDRYRRRSSVRVPGAWGQGVKRSKCLQVPDGSALVSCQWTTTKYRASEQPIMDSNNIQQRHHSTEPPLRTYTLAISASQPSAPPHRLFITMTSQDAGIW